MSARPNVDSASTVMADLARNYETVTCLATYITAIPLMLWHFIIRIFYRAGVSLRNEDMTIYKNTQYTVGKPN